MKEWRISEAKARLSEVLGYCVNEPQVIYNRKRPVAALIDMEEYEAFLEYKRSKRKKTIAEWFDELDEIKKSEPGDFELPTRTSRSVPNFDEEAGK
jgi:prevent-host-death family protein